MEINEIFQKNKSPHKNITDYLIFLRGHKCECCSLTEWLNQPITLHTHHIDGDKMNNELENLKLLCPNCHSQTDNFGSKNIKKATVSEEKFVEALKTSYSIRQALLSLNLSDASGNYTRAKNLIEKYNIIMPYTIAGTQKKYCEICGAEINKQSTYCIECAHLLQRRAKRPSREELKNLIRTTSYVDLAKEFGVSGNAIKKWAIAEGLPANKAEIKSYSDEEWEKL